VLHSGDHRLATSADHSHVCLRSSKRPMRLACAYALRPAFTLDLGQRIITSPAWADELVPILLKCSGVGSCLRHWSIFDIANNEREMGSERCRRIPRRCPSSSDKGCAIAVPRQFQAEVRTCGADLSGLEASRYLALLDQTNSVRIPIND